MEVFLLCLAFFTPVQHRNGACWNNVWDDVARMRSEGCSPRFFIISFNCWSSSTSLLKTHSRFSSSLTVSEPCRSLVPEPVFVQALHDGVPAVYDLHQSLHQPLLLPLLLSGLQVICCSGSEASTGGQTHRQSRGSGNAALPGFSSSLRSSPSTPGCCCSSSWVLALTAGLLLSKTPSILFFSARFSLTSTPAPIPS